MLFQWILISLSGKSGFATEFDGFDKSIPQKFRRCQDKMVKHQHRQVYLQMLAN